MNDVPGQDRVESATRTDVARQIARGFSRNPRVTALLVAGSVSRGDADSHSDIDVDVYWSAPPTDDERRQAVRLAGGVLVSDIAPLEDEEWAESFVVGGFRATTSMFLNATFERYLTEVVDGWSTEELPQIRIAAVQHGVPLIGEEVVERWRKRAAIYPDGLRRAMVRRHLRRQTRWAAAPMLAERGDFLLLFDTLHAAAHAMLGALHGVNRVYLAHPGFKWIDRVVAELPVAPAQFSDRLASIFRLAPTAGVSVAQELLNETLALVEEELPGEDVSEARRWMTARRGT